MPLNLADGVSIAETDDGAVLLDERSGRYWRLNGSGARVLQGLLAGRGAREAAVEAAAGARVAPEQAEQDAAALLAKLRTAGLVTP
ncbi:lasso peptide biosynthesis PqqD family chaperone [Streptomyces sp. 1331.2]|uniref:lasso peptide biosynthesis PqqD family chaperone n=1 Tax=Streptomyces sp. 1331.2 TaxID=1938835 RepID=UPI000BCF3CDE|nr:lasso peptide biosynthesis PqqD family chaperone [Streptomyces sp. 1331.2]SOB81274.1 PqqD family protein, HPr-rel-A system [Streptomyces sp. 1331.2]